MRRRSLLFVAVLVLVAFSAIGADSGARSPEAAEPWEPLWRFATHG